MKTKREAFATITGLDFSETEDYRYHYGKTSQPVWAVGDTYYCITKGTQKPAKYNGEEPWGWEELKDDAINKHGFKCYKADI